MTEPTRDLQYRVERPVTDPLELEADAPLTEDEAGYVEAARAANTLRGYRSDWAEFTGWCAAHGLDPLPPAPGTVAGYLTELARAGPKVGTMSRRLAALGDPVRRPAAQLPRRDRQRPGGGGLGGHPAHPRRPADPGRPADAAGAVRHPGRLPADQGLEDQGPVPRAGPGRAAGHRAAAGRVRGRAAPQRVLVVDAEQSHGALAVAVIGPGRARTRARLGGSRAAWRRVAGRAGQSRTTNTGQLAWWTHRSQTDPSVKLPCPRAPTTSRLAFSAMSISTRAALPCTNSRRTSVGRWSPNTSVSASSRQVSPAARTASPISGTGATAALRWAASEAQRSAAVAPAEPSTPTTMGRSLAGREMPAWVASDADVVTMISFRPARAGRGRRGRYCRLPDQSAPAAPTASGAKAAPDRPK